MPGPSQPGTLPRYSATNDPAEVAPEWRGHVRFGTAIKEARHHAGLSLEGLMDLFEAKTERRISRERLRQIEQGRFSVESPTLRMICEVLGLTVPRLPTRRVGRVSSVLGDFGTNKADEARDADLSDLSELVEVAS
jgi:transcriptional regulator with XRE-family HTH domain